MPAPLGSLHVLSCYAVSILLSWPTILSLTVLSTSFRTSFSPLAAQLFFLQDVSVIQNSQIDYAKVLGTSGSINDAANAYIQALFLAATHTDYGVSICPV